MRLEPMVEIRKELFLKAAIERQKWVKPIRPCHYCNSLTTNEDRLCSETCRTEWNAEGGIR